MLNEHRLQAAVDGCWLCGRKKKNDVIALLFIHSFHFFGMEPHLMQLRIDPSISITQSTIALASDYFIYTHPESGIYSRFSLSLISIFSWRSHSSANSLVSGRVYSDDNCNNICPFIPSVRPSAAALEQTQKIWNNNPLVRSFVRSWKELDVMCARVYTRTYEQSLIHFFLLHLLPTRTVKCCSYYSSGSAVQCANTQRASAASLLLKVESLPLNSTHLSSAQLNLLMYYVSYQLVSF